MPLPSRIDQFENFLIQRTEQTVNTAFLWLLILKELHQQPQPSAQLRKQIARKHHNPHRTTFYSSVYVLKTMKLIENNEGNLQVTLKGKEILSRAVQHLKSNLVIILGGELNGRGKTEGQSPHPR